MFERVMIVNLFPTAGNCQFGEADRSNDTGFMFCLSLMESVTTRHF